MHSGTAGAERIKAELCPKKHSVGWLGLVVRR